MTETQAPLLGLPRRPSATLASARLANSHLLGSASTLKPDQEDDEEWLHAEQLLPSQRRPSACRRAALACTLLLVVALGGTLGVQLHAGQSCLAEAAAAEAAAAWPRFLVVGDWGRRGHHNQSAVAAALAAKAASLRPDFVLSVGDNFYPSGLTSPLDPLFTETFTDVYHQTSLQVPWHAVLGNHDYGQHHPAEEAEEEVEQGWSGAGGDGSSTGSASSSGVGTSSGGTVAPACGSWDPGCFYSPLHELDARLAERDPRWHAERSFQLPLAGGRVELFFIDTTPLMRLYDSAPWRSAPGGLDEQSPQGQLRELEARLARSTAQWKLVIGHHPIRTNHRPWHAFAELVEGLEPLLNAHGVQLYLNGRDAHDHNLALLHAPGNTYHQVTSGAGSRLSSPGFRGTKDALFQAVVNGFVAVSLGPEEALLEYMGLDSSEPLFSATVPRRP